MKIYLYEWAYNLHFYTILLHVLTHHMMFRIVLKLQSQIWCQKFYSIQIIIYLSLSLFEGGGGVLMLGREFGQVNKLLINNVNLYLKFRPGTCMCFSFIELQLERFWQDDEWK
jgi:hypothetical protein